MQRNQEYQKIIKDYFKDCKAIKSTGICKFFIKYPEIKKYAEIILNQIKEYEKISYVIIAIAKNITLQHCHFCNKLLSFSKMKRKRKFYFCSLQCFNKSGLNADLVKETMNKKYGVDNYFQTSQCKEKIKNISIKKYGVDNPAKADIIKQKIRKKSTANYQSVIKKAKETNLQKYNTEYPCQLSQVKEKIKQTCLKKYGADNYMKSKTGKEKSIENCREKYNVDYYSQTQKYHDSLRKNNIEKYGTQFKSFLSILKLKNVEPYFDLSQFKGTGYSYKWKCKSCGNIFESIYHNGQLFKTCKCQHLTKHYSNLQKELTEFCKKFFPDLKENDRTLISPLEVDIYIPEISVAIEFNGCFWHSLECFRMHGKEQEYDGYHLRKTEACEKLGIRLIHIWEDEWTKDPEEVKKFLENVFLGKREFSEDIIELPRDRYSVKGIQGYSMTLESPQWHLRDGYSCQDCGRIKLRKISG